MDVLRFVLLLLLSILLVALERMLPSPVVRLAAIVVLVAGLLSLSGLWPRGREARGTAAARQTFRGRDGSSGRRRRGTGEGYACPRCGCLHPRGDDAVYCRGRGRSIVDEKGASSDGGNGVYFGADSPTPAAGASGPPGGRRVLPASPETPVRPANCPACQALLTADDAEEGCPNCGWSP